MRASPAPTRVQPPPPDPASPSHHRPSSRFHHHPCRRPPRALRVAWLVIRSWFLYYAALLLVIPSILWAMHGGDGGDSGLTRAPMSLFRVYWWLWAALVGVYDLSLGLPSTASLLLVTPGADRVVTLSKLASGACLLLAVLLTLDCNRVRIQAWLARQGAAYVGTAGSQSRNADQRVPDG